MFRLAMAFSALALTATSAAASNYSGKPVAPVSGQFIARDIVWSCGPAACPGRNCVSLATGELNLRPMAVIHCGTFLTAVLTFMAIA